MKRRPWSVAEAKAKFSHLLVSAHEEPQLIARRGREIAVVLDIDEYRRVAARSEEPSPREAWRRFLTFSAALRARGGATLAVAKRRSRRRAFPGRRSS